MLQDAVNQLAAGIPAEERTLYARQVSTGRFADEVNVAISLRCRDAEAPLLVAKVFYGRPPHYRPWVECFDIRDALWLGGERIVFRESAAETAVLTHFSTHLGPGEDLFVEYDYDPETAQALQGNVPPPATRLGFELLRLGYTWFKDWYFPEGLLEGGQKLQAEKPIDAEKERRHRRDILRELSCFIDAMEAETDRTEILGRALGRARRILKGRDPLSGV